MALNRSRKKKIEDFLEKNYSFGNIVEEISFKISESFASPLHRRRKNQEKSYPKSQVIAVRNLIRLP
jgi:hypothetical protein